ncbi:MAG: histidine kinase [Actinomycetes bacterium]|jgi:two-component system sensor histidine kinase LytS|nr:histidine kinase [Actinomycetes bacterium]
MTTGTPDTTKARLHNPRYPGRLEGVVRSDALSIVAVAGIILTSGVTVLGILARWSVGVVIAALAVLVIIALAVAVAQVMRGPDRLRALESDRMLSIASEAVSYIRGGLTEENAQKVCEIILTHTPDAAACAITDTTRVLGFAGAGADHHTPGRTIVTQATKNALKRNATEVVGSKDEIGCPKADCPLHAAIIVVLDIAGRAVGTLKYYYESERSLTESALTGAEGLARLLSTQLVIGELEAQTALATSLELKALQAQINPHFLFNTLNTISAYIRTDPTAARHLLRQFAAFYRRTLQHADEPITVDLELEYLTQYFELEQARFGDRVSLSIDIDDAARDLPMPSFMLQPLVENSIAHGMRADGEALSIVVSAVCDRSDGSYLFTVSDDGCGMNADAAVAALKGAVSERSDGLGIALRNVNERLRGFYSERTTLAIDSAEGYGTRVSFRVYAD